jgi:hypothetical protein
VPHNLPARSHVSPIIQSARVEINISFKVFSTVISEKACEVNVSLSWEERDLM